MVSNMKCVGVVEVQNKKRGTKEIWKGEDKQILLFLLDWSIKVEVPLRLFKHRMLLCTLCELDFFLYPQH